MEINFENHAACIARIMARGSIEKEEARALLQEVAEGAERQRVSGSSDPVVDAAWKLSQDLKAIATSRKADAVMNAAKRLDRKTETIDATGGSRGTAAGDAAVKHGLSTLYSMEAQQKENVQSLRNVISRDWRASFLAEADKLGISKVLADRESFRAVSERIWDARNGKVTLSATDPIDRAATQIMKYEEVMRSRMNGEVGRDVIADAQDFVASTSHSVKLLRRGGRDLPPVANADEAKARWVDKVQNWLGEKTFDDIGADAAKRKDFAEKVFESLYDGYHQRAGITQGPKFEAGGYNIARKMSQNRTLFWKDGGSWADYQALYGEHRDWMNLMLNTMDRNARSAALMRYWGTNAQASMETYIRQIGEHFHNSGDIEAAALWKKKAPAMLNALKLLDGTNDLPQNEMAAMIGNTARAVMDVSLLGSVQLTHLSSLLGTITAEAPFHGISRMTAFGNVIGSLFKNLSDEEKLELRSQQSSYGTAMARQNADHFARGWSFTKDEGYMIPGMVSAMQSTFMKYTGLQYIFDHVKAGWKEMLTNSYARYLEKPFDQLDAHVQQMLNMYHLGPDEWKLLQTAKPFESNGDIYLTPNVTETIDRGGIEALLRSRGEITNKTTAAKIDQAINKFQTHLRDRLGMLYEDSADHVIVTPGVREQAMLGGARTDWAGELSRSLMQFKSWPIAAWHQVYARQYMESLTKSERWWGLGAIFGATMIGGYLRSTIQDIANGLPPREPRTTGEVLPLALYWFSRGGGLGIWGDELFGEMNKISLHGSTAMAGGPLAGTAATLIQMFHDFSTMTAKAQLDQSLDFWGNEQKHFWTDYGKPLVGHVPFANLIYLKGALNYLLFWHLNEAMNPGWWQRTNSALQKEQGRNYIGFRPYQQPPYSPF